jgi:hypothetical protein
MTLPSTPFVLFRSADGSVARRVPVSRLSGLEERG